MMNDPFRIIRDLSNQIRNDASVHPVPARRRVDINAEIARLTAELIRDEERILSS